MLLTVIPRAVEEAGLMELEILPEIQSEIQRIAPADSAQLLDRTATKSNSGLVPLTRRFLKFGCVGTSGMAVDLGLYGLLLAAMPQSAARALAIAVAMTWNFIWNRQVTFADARRRHWLRQYVGYCASCLLGALVNWSTSLSIGGLHPFLAEHPLVAAMMGVAAGMAFNFAFCLLIVFRPQANESPVT